MNDRLDALFVTFEAGGNVPPMLGIAQRVIAGGGRALVLGSPSQRGAVEAAGLPFEPFSHEQAYDVVHPVSLRTNLAQISATLADRRMVADVMAAARRTSPHVVVVDCMLLGVLDGMTKAGFRTVTLVHTLPSFWRAYARGPVGLAATLRRLRPGRVWASASGSLATVLPGFDDGPGAAFAGLLEVGPVTPAPDPAADPTAAGPPRDRLRILISLSTNWFPGQEQTMQRLLDAVGGLDLDTVVTTGRSIDPASLRAPANAELHRTVPHDLLLPNVDLLVGHGGHGTTMRALAHDVPVLVVPSFSFADQRQVGRRVEASGAGRTMPSGSTVAAFREAIRELAGPGPHRDAAAELGGRIRASDPAGAAVSYLMAGSSSWPTTPPISPTPSSPS